jgi:hypothetical protein
MTEEGKNDIVAKCPLPRGEGDKKGGGESGWGKWGIFQEGMWEGLSQFGSGLQGRKTQLGQGQPRWKEQEGKGWHLCVSGTEVS